MKETNPIGYIYNVLTETFFFCLEHKTTKKEEIFFNYIPIDEDYIWKGNKYQKPIKCDLCNIQFLHIS